MKVYAATIFLSAFLLFLVQPLIGKYILPWFGSAPSVWTTCLLFFQLLLLAGYAYAHLLSRLSMSRQIIIHVVLLVAVLFLLPITPSDSWKATAQDDPTWRITALLTISLGGPYFLLSSTSPLLQRWFSRTQADRSPYRLYAVSNAGSFLALIAYPLLVEPKLSLGSQTSGWSGLFILFVGLSFLTVWFLKRSSGAAQTSVPSATAEGASVTLGTALMWLSLSTCGSVVLLATINHIGRDVPPVPFLVILPLALYLLTFIIAFDSTRWYRRSVAIPMLCVGMAGVAMLTLETLGLSIIVLIGVYLFALLACCLSCHGELARLKPTPEHLTLFYLLIALGGALGGVFVVVIAPYLFDDVWEYPIGLEAAYLLVMYLVVRDRAVGGSPSEDHPAAAARSSKARPTISASESPGVRRQAWGTWWAAGGVLLGFAVILGAFAWKALNIADMTVVQTRNFYGVVRVLNVTSKNPVLNKYIMYHGTTDHGFQYRDPSRRLMPTAYYTLRSGVGMAIEEHPERQAVGRQFRIGVVGLGVGTLSAYANHRPPDAPVGPHLPDYLRFYEINPEVTRIASEFFTYLRDASERGADVDVFEGDARLTMERQLDEGDAQHFDVLVIDAFSGDTVPMHLLTTECFEIYRRHLAPGGIMAFHVSSRFLDLVPVVAGLANHSEMNGGLVLAPTDTRIAAYHSAWVLVTDNEAFLHHPVIEQYMTPMDQVATNPVVWTDDFGSLLQVLK